MIRYARYLRFAEIGLGNVPHTAFQGLLSCQMNLSSIQTPGFARVPSLQFGSLLLIQIQEISFCFKL